MIESFLIEKNSYIKKSLLSKPDVLLVKNLSIIPVTIWALIPTILALIIWLKGDIIEKYIPLSKIHFDSQENIIQIQIIITTIAAILILAGVQWQKSVTVTITSDYISIDKGISRKRKNHIVMLSDISDISFKMGLLGFIGRFGTLKIKRKDDSRIILHSIPASVTKVIREATKLYTEPKSEK